MSPLLANRSLSQPDKLDAFSQPFPSSDNILTAPAANLPNQKPSLSLFIADHFSPMAILRASSASP
eukprot:1471201-Rhodomonas_salina.2